MVSSILSEQKTNLPFSNNGEELITGKEPVAGQAIRNDDTGWCAPHQESSSSSHLQVIATRTTPTKSPTSVTNPSPQQEPVQYVDERTKVLGRRAELEALRKRNSLQQKKAAFNSQSPLSTSLASFFLQQKQMKNEVRKNRLGALNSLSRYRLKDSDVILGSPRTPKQGGSSRFGLGSTIMPSAYSCMADITDEFFRKQKQSDIEWRKKKESTLKKLHTYRQQQTDVLCCNNDTSEVDDDEAVAAVVEEEIFSSHKDNKESVDETSQTSTRPGTSSSEDDRLFESLLMCRMMIHAELAEFFYELSEPGKESETDGIQNVTPARHDGLILDVGETSDGKLAVEAPKVEPTKSINDSELSSSDAVTVNEDKAPDNGTVPKSTGLCHNAILEESQVESIPEQFQEDDIGIGQCCRCEILDAMHEALISQTTSCPQESDEPPAVQYSKDDADQKYDCTLDPPPDLKVVAGQVKAVHDLSGELSSDELQAKETPIDEVENQTDLGSTDNSQDTRNEPETELSTDVTSEKTEVDAEAHNAAPGKEDVSQLQMEAQSNNNRELEVDDKLPRLDDASLLLMPTQGNNNREQEADDDASQLQMETHSSNNREEELNDKPIVEDGASKSQMETQSRNSTEEADDKPLSKDDDSVLQSETQRNNNAEQEDPIEPSSPASTVEKSEANDCCKVSTETADAKDEESEKESIGSEEDSTIAESDVVREALSEESELRLLAQVNVIGSDDDDDDDTNKFDDANEILSDLDAGEDKVEQCKEPCLVSSILDPFSEARPSFDNSDQAETYGSSKKTCPLGLQEGSMSLEDFVASGVVSSPMPTVDSSVSSIGSSIEERTGDIGGLSLQSSVSSLSSFWQDRCVPIEKYNKAALMCTQEQYLPNLHSTKGPCERCFSLASAKEKAKFRSSGRCLHIMVVRGGCHKSCTAFPRSKDEPPVRLCRKCYFDTHRAPKAR